MSLTRKVDARKCSGNCRVQGKLENRTKCWTKVVLPLSGRWSEHWSAVCSDHWLYIVTRVIRWYVRSLWWNVQLKLCDESMNLSVNIFWKTVHRQMESV